MGCFCGRPAFRRGRQRTGSKQRRGALHVRLKREEHDMCASKEGTTKHRVLRKEAAQPRPMIFLIASMIIRIEP